MDDMVYREDLYYQKFTDVPFTGEIHEGLEIGALKNGRPDGKWVGYHENETKWVLGYNGHAVKNVFLDRAKPAW